MTPRFRAVRTYIPTRWPLIPVGHPLFPPTGPSLRQPWEVLKLLLIVITRTFWTVDQAGQPAALARQPVSPLPDGEDREKTQ